MEYPEAKPYRYVAEIYAHLMRFIDYNEWAEYYYLLSKDRISDNSKVLELASGNCKLSNSLNKYYKNIVSTDLSYEMLKMSEMKDLKRVCCNMTELPFNNKFDFIFSAFDSINYLTSKKLLNKLFQQVYLLLSNDGLFSFDVSLEKNSLKNTRFLNRKGNYKGIKYKQKSSYDKEKRIHVNKFEIEFSSGETVKEIHVQRIYPMEYYFELLMKNHFIVKECLDAFSFNDADYESERIQFVVIKDKNYADIQ
jgi:SAM-dependent methyltransferase